MRIFLLLGYFVLCTWSSFSDASRAGDIPVIDLSSADLNKSLHKLDGDWLFYWEKFIEPSGAVEPGFSRIEVPNGWEKNYPTYGFASYRVRVKLPKDHPPELALKIRRVKMAHRLFINGRLVAEKGIAGKSPDHYRTEHVPYIAYFEVAKDTDTLDIVLHVSNFNYIRSGITQSLMLGTPFNAHEAREHKLFQSAFVSGAFFIIALYNLTFFFNRRKEKLVLYFALFCMAISLRMLVTDEKYLLELAPWISLDRMLSLELLSVYFALPMLHIFVSHLFEQDFYITSRFNQSRQIRILRKISYSVLIFLILVWLATPLPVHARLVVPFEIYVFLMLLHILIIAVRVSIKRRRGAFLFSLGFIVLFATGVNDILHERGIVSTAFFFYIGALTFVFAQASLLSSRVAGAFNEIEGFNLTLEQKVKERTQEINKIAEENRRLSKSITEVLEEERRNIAKEMHDGVNGMIMGAKLNTLAICQRLKKGSSGAPVEKAKNDLEKLVERLDDIYNKARQVVKRLRPEAIDALGLQRAIEALLDDYNHSMSDCRIDYFIAETVNKLPENVRICMYRILQESLTNIVKHARATSISIRMTTNENKVVLNVRDNGVGFKSGHADGIGLISMRERALYVGGEFKIHSTQGEGTAITVTVPYLDGGADERAISDQSIS